MTYETLTAFFGWMTVLNFAVLIAAGLGMLFFRDWAIGLHARLFDMAESDVRKAWFGFLSNYKVLTLTLSLVPYLALRLAG